MSNFTHKKRGQNKGILNPKIPVYISVTSIFKNQDILLQTLQSIIKQTKSPDKIYLYLSSDKSFFDNGFINKKITNEKLKKFIVNNKLIEIMWGNDIGPYGKLLPLLKEKWHEDCIIITIDDDTIYDENLIKNLVEDYIKYNCVINYRGFTPLFDKLENFDYSKRYPHKKHIPYSLYNFPTGKGGVLYKPEFFHKTQDLIFNDKIYLNICDKQDDIWFYIVRILNNINCYIDSKCWVKKDITSRGLFVHFNSKNNNNTIVFKKLIAKLKDSYNF